MKFEVPVRELITRRYSCRTYDINPVDPDTRDRLCKAFETLPVGFMGETFRAQFIEATDAMLLDSKVLDYGTIHNARNFLLAGISLSPMTYESFGYLMEHLVLKATELGLGSCWVGYFNLDFFGGMELTENEVVPSIIVLGNIAERRTLTDKICRFVVRASKRKDWKKVFFHGNFDTPLSQEEAGRFSKPLEMVRIAPSSGNTQPWLIVKEKGRDVFHFYMQVVNKIYHQRHLHNIDIGIAMSHFELSARENNIINNGNSDNSDNSGNDSNNYKWERLESVPVQAPKGAEYICTFH